ncbi:MAG: phytoene desaturase [Burkholderiales bacterium]|nr:phytoene desaturase [Burkholderiales bacterium]
MLTLAPTRAAAETVEDRRPLAIVVGSGFGGLAAAVRLGARGYRVQVLERLEQPGGRAAVFRQDGFVFDAGPTIITLPSLFEELWTLCGRRFADDVDLRPLDPFYRLVFPDGSTFACSGDDAAMREEVRRLNPGDLDGYARFLEVSKEIYGFAFETLGQIPFNTLGTMAKAIPGFVRHRADRSVHALVQRYIKDPRLRIAFSFHPLFIGGNPFRVTSMYALVSYLERRFGVHFAMGGTHKLVEGLVSLIEGQGNTVRCDTEVARIDVTEGRATGVTLSSGERIAADVVVSNADSAWTYTKLLPPGASRRWTPQKIAGAKFSMSLFVWYFGTNRQYPAVDHHTILLGPRYRELLTDIFDRKVLADDFSLYIHRPTATDPSMAPPGCDAFYALSPVPHLEAGVDWTTMAEPYRRKIEAALGASLMPGLREAVVSSKVITPIDFRDRLSSVHGAAFGLEPTLLQSAWFRPHNVCEDIPNLYLVGAGTHPGAGVPGVLSSARILDQLVPHGATLR